VRDPNRQLVNLIFFYLSGSSSGFKSRRDDSSRLTNLHGTLYLEKYSPRKKKDIYLLNRVTKGSTIMQPHEPILSGYVLLKSSQPTYQRSISILRFRLFSQRYPPSIKFSKQNITSISTVAQSITQLLMVNQMIALWSTALTCYTAIKSQTYSNTAEYLLQSPWQLDPDTCVNLTVGIRSFFNQDFPFMSATALKRDTLIGRGTDGQVHTHTNGQADGWIERLKD